MHNEYKKQSPYRGFWVILFFLIMVPFGLFSVVKAVLDEYSRYSPELDMATAKVAIELANAKQRGVTAEI